MANPSLAPLDSPAVARLASGLRPLLVLLGIAAAVAAGVTVVLWSQGPNWGLLYGGLSPSDANDVAQALQSANVPYKVDAGSGGILVPQGRISEARLKLAAQGLPAGDGAGLELIRKDPGFGVSQFMETARYQHALEVELVRTITSLHAVEAARVHLAVPTQSAFVRSRREPSASVFLRLKPGRRLEAEQVSGIVHLVASSIPELEADQVTVIDQNGHLLSAPKNGAMAGADAQLEAARRLEETYADRIQELLAPLVGSDRVRAQVAVDLEAGVSEEAREQYRPDSQIVRSEQLAEQTSQSPLAGIGGIPGALTNQPPPAGVALPPGTAAPQPGAAEPRAADPTSAQSEEDAAAAAAAAAATLAAAAGSSSRESTRNFEIDRTLSYTRQPPGRVRRVTVAVLIDHVKSAGPDGQAVTKPLAPEQLANVTQLVKDAVGFDAARGDSVNVVNASFLEPGDVPVAADMPLWQQPLLRDVLRLVLGAVLVIILLLVVVRPLLKSLVAPVRAAALPMGATLATVQSAAAGGAAGAPALGYEQQLAQARGLVTQDPKRVAQVVRNWVNSDE
jgi:flagellar M-ring protein FliF